MLTSHPKAQTHCLRRPHPNSVCKMVQFIGCVPAKSDKDADNARREKVARWALLLFVSGSANVRARRARRLARPTPRGAHPPTPTTSSCTR